MLPLGEAEADRTGALAELVLVARRGSEQRLLSASGLQPAMLSAACDTGVTACDTGAPLSTTGQSSSRVFLASG